MLSHVQLFATPWTIALQVPLSMEFSRQEYWGELPFPTPGDLPNPGIEPASCISCTGRQILYYCTTWKSHDLVQPNKINKYFKTSASSTITCHTDAIWVCAHVCIPKSVHVPPQDLCMCPHPQQVLWADPAPSSIPDPTSAWTWGPNTSRGQTKMAS